MSNEDLEAFEKFYEDIEKEPEELVATGAIQVIREKKSPEMISKELSPYYISLGKKFQEESHLLMKVATIIFVGFSALQYFAYTNTASNFTQSIFHPLAAMCSLLALSCFACSLRASGFLARFITATKPSLTPQPLTKEALRIFSRGYSYKQLATRIIALLMVIASLFSLFLLITSSYWLVSLIMITVALAWLFVEFRSWNEHALTFYFANELLGSLPEETSKVKKVKKETSKTKKAALPKKKKKSKSLEVKSLVATLKNDTARVRREAIKELGLLRSSEARSILIDHLGDPSAVVRAQAITVLSRHKERSIIGSIKCLFSDEAPEVRAAVVEALGKLKDLDSIDMLVAALEDEAPEVRGSAAEALGHIKYKKAIRYLSNKTQDEDWFVRHKAVIALGKMRNYLNIVTIEQLTKMVDDEHETVCIASRHVLQKILDGMAQDDPMYRDVQRILESAPSTEIDESLEIALTESEECSAEENIGFEDYSADDEVFEEFIEEENLEDFSEEEENDVPPGSKLDDSQNIASDEAEKNTNSEVEVDQEKISPDSKEEVNSDLQKTEESSNKKHSEDNSDKEE